MLESKPLSYLTVALFLVVMISAMYLEFPVITGLILTIMIAVWLWSRERSHFSPPPLESRRVALMHASAVNRSNHSARLLGGLNSFALHIETPASWRMPFIRRRLRRIAADVLSRYGMRTDENERCCFNNPDCARLLVSTQVDFGRPFNQVRAKLTVQGLVSAQRSARSVSDVVSIWSYEQSRAAVGENTIHELEDCIRSCLHALVVALNR